MRALALKMLELENEVKERNQKWRNEGKKKKGNRQVAKMRREGR